MQICGDQRFFVQRRQHALRSGLAGRVAGEDSLCCRRAEPHGAERSHAADEAVHEGGHIFQRTAKEHTAQPGNIKASQLCQHVQRVGGVGVVDSDTALNGVDLAAQSRVRQPRAAPGHLGSGAVKQHGGHGARRRCIADAHFSGRQQLNALRLLRTDKRNARRDGLHGLGAGHGRTLCKVPRAGGDAAVHHAGHGCARDAHVDGHDGATGSGGHPADTGAPRGKVHRHGAGDAGVGLADALCHDAVVSAEHEHRAAAEVELCAAGQRGGVLQHRFQLSQSTQRLCQCRPVGVGGGAGGLVRRGDGFEQGFQFGFGHIFPSL